MKIGALVDDEGILIDLPCHCSNVHYTHTRVNKSEYAKFNWWFANLLR